MNKADSHHPDQGKKLSYVISLVPGDLAVTLAGTAANDHIVSGGEGDTITLRLGGSDDIATGSGSGSGDDSVMTAATAVPLLETTRNIIGDRAPVDTDPEHQKVNGLVHDWTDDLGNRR